MHSLARLIADVELALNDDLHLVVRVRVHQRSTLLETVEAAADGLVGVGAGEDVAEEGVVVGD